MGIKEYFLGIDPSLTGTGVVLITEKATVLGYKLIKTDPKDFNAPVDRKMFIAQEIRELLFEHGLSSDPLSSARKPVMGAMEAPAFYGKGSNITLAELYGFLQSEIFPEVVSCIGVSPNSLKEFMTGDGKASKKDMMMVAKTRLGADHDIAKNDNLADAYALARLARYIYTRPEAVDRQELISVTKRKDWKPKCSVLF